MREQIADGHRQIMVGVHQTGGWRDDTVPVRIRVVGEREAVLIFESHQPGHRIGTRTIHADFAVMVDRHERERRIKFRIDDRDVQLINGIDRLPIG